MKEVVFWKTTRRWDVGRKDLQGTGRGGVVDRILGKPETGWVQDISVCFLIPLTPNPSVPEILIETKWTV